MKLFLTAVLLALTATAAIAEPIEGHDIRVIDGDTIRIYQRQPNIRLVGFNAPETRKPNCEAEREIGGRATRFLRDLIRASDLDFEYVGKVGVGACAWGRDCGTLKANGRDVGDLLIAARLAVPFICPGGRCPPTPRPWCTAVAPIPSLAPPSPNNPVVREIWPNPVVREIWERPPDTEQPPMRCSWPKGSTGKCLLWDFWGFERPPMPLKELERAQP